MHDSNDCSVLDCLNVSPTLQKIYHKLPYLVDQQKENKGGFKWFNGGVQKSRLELKKRMCSRDILALGAHIEIKQRVRGHPRAGLKFDRRA